MEEGSFLELRAKQLLLRALKNGMEAPTREESGSARCEARDRAKQAESAATDLIPYLQEAQQHYEDNQKLIVKEDVARVRELQQMKTSLMQSTASARFALLDRGIQIEQLNALRAESESVHALLEAVNTAHELEAKYSRTVA